MSLEEMKKRVRQHVDLSWNRGHLALAEQRAVAVRRYLVSLGVGEDRLEVVSYGEDKPAVVGADEAAWAKNRRVEFVIVK